MTLFYMSQSKINYLHDPDSVNTLKSALLRATEKPCWSLLRPTVTSQQFVKMQIVQYVQHMHIFPILITFVGTRKNVVYNDSIIFPFPI